MGEGNCLFGTEISEDKTIPLFRGNVSMVEIKSADTNPTSIPNAGVWHQGELNSTKYFDISIAGKCKTDASDKVKLDIQPASQIPDFFTKSIEGKIVFAAPQVVGTIKAAKGHNSWVKIELKTVNGDITSDVAKHVCLGIKKNDEVDFFDIIHAGNLASMYVDVTQESYIELIPLLSKTATTEGSRYVAVTPGDGVSFTDLTIPTTGEFNFGSVYRVNISVHNSQWVTEQPTNLTGWWYNYGRIGVGSITDQHGQVHKNQLVAIDAATSQLAYSSDGIHWTSTVKVHSGQFWDIAPIYGNGIWCVANVDSNFGMRRSIDGDRNWSDTLATISSQTLSFYKNTFMTVAGNGIVYTSSDAEVWTQIGNINFKNGKALILIHGNNEWLCGSSTGYTYHSKEGKGSWEYLGDGLYRIKNENNLGHFWFGGCYANGYFYVVNEGGLIARSQNGKDWERFLTLSGTGYLNVTYYKNKLYAQKNAGSPCYIGLFRPDGTIESKV